MLKYQTDYEYNIEEARALISSALRVSIELILTLITLMVAKKGFNSKNI